MKKVVPLILLLISFCKKPANQALDANALKQSTWEGPQGVVMTFDDKNVKYEIPSGDQSCGIAAYTIQGNKLRIEATTKCPDGGQPEYGHAATVCDYVTDDQALDYKILLQCGDFKAGRKNAKLAAGETVKINNKDFVSMGWVTGQLSETAVFRSEPDAKAKEVTIETSGVMTGPASSEGGTKSTSLKQGATVSLVARTNEKQKVQNWENYWYYVEFYGAKSYYGWIFGEFIKQ